MTADQNKKTTRTFQCKDALWQKFEQMARELECSVDYLVNDAMKQYARQRGYGAAAGSPSIPPPMPGGGSRSMPPPPPPARGAQPAAPGAAGAKLSISYQGETFPVTKDRFIIGRGKQSSDLTIKDPNVSRQHAMIEFSNGQYYIVDMGSTNGVEYNGQRVQRKVISEGDAFKVCDHELKFSFS